LPCTPTTELTFTIAPPRRFIIGRVTARQV
jgi:hypothetical protein